MTQKAINSRARYEKKRPRAEGDHQDKRERDANGLLMTREAIYNKTRYAEKKEAGEVWPGEAAADPGAAKKLEKGLTQRQHQRQIWQSSQVPDTVAKSTSKPLPVTSTTAAAPSRLG